MHPTTGYHQAQRDALAQARPPGAAAPGRTPCADKPSFSRRVLAVLVTRNS
jgi:hypothetical protein